MAAPHSSATLPRPDTDMSRTRLLVPPPSQISHDTPGEDNLIPLSPQWLLPNTSDNKAGITPTEKYPTPFVAHGDRSDLMKSPGNGDEMQENQKKTDVFRPTFLDYESERRDRWRDEERDTNLSVRKDRWREGDKELVGNRKTERWADNSPARHVGEARWTPADKRADPSREIDHDQRHDSKWSTRWGPGNKQMDKKTDVGKYNDMPFDKGLSHSSNPGKDEKEGDRYRPWRPSSLQGRGRADPPHYHTQTIRKEVPTSNHERGHENNTPLTFSAGRGRVSYGGGSINANQSHLQSPGFVPEKVDSGEEPSPLRYSRTKLLEIFRQIDIRSSNALEGLVHVSSLTQEESVEPLALCVPGPEESAILKAIDKGDIVSSGAPQISKDASSGRSTMDNHHRPTEHKYNVEGMREDSATIKSEDEVFNNRDTTSKERASTQSSTPWRPSFLADPSRTLSGDGFDVPNDMHLRSSAISWSEAQKERQDGRVADSSYSRNEVKWQGGKDSTDWKHSSVVVDRDVESRNLPQPSPEDLLLHYKDPQGLVQGPFSGTDIIGWFEAGYFGIDLQVRLASAPSNSPFSLLGDVMPHLRGKARAPPGFKTARPTDVIDVPNQFSLSGLRNAIPGGVDLIGNERRPAQGSSVETENRFLESLMSGEIRSSPLDRFASKDMQGFRSHISTGMPTVGTESGEPLGLFARKLTLERQDSSANPSAFWPPRDAAPVVSNPSVNRESNIPQANPLSSINDIPQQYHPQKVSALQGFSDGFSSGINGLGGWPNLYGGSESFKEKIGMPHGQNFHQPVYNLQQHNPQSQIQASVTNLPGLPLDSQGVPPENLKSGLVQDPQLLNLLQQQYLLQLQSQQSMPGAQLSLQDRFLLLQQHQKQEEQQKLWQQQQLLLQQQQQLLSNAFLEQQLAQRFGDPSLRQLQVSAPAIDNSVPQLLSQMFQVNSQVPLSNMLVDRNVNAEVNSQVPLSNMLVDRNVNTEVNSQVPLFNMLVDRNVNAEVNTQVPLSNVLDDKNVNVAVNSQVPLSNVLDDRNVSAANIPLRDSQDLSHRVPLECSSPLQLPRLMSGGFRQGLSAVPAQGNNTELNDSSVGSVTMGNFACTEAMEKSHNAISPASLSASSSMVHAPKSNLDIVDSALKAEYVGSADRKLQSSKGGANDIMSPEVTNGAEACTGVFEETPVKECNEEVSEVKEPKTIESRELKKTSEKKSRKQKSSKALPSTDHVKATKEKSPQYSKQSAAGKVSPADQSEVAVNVSGTLVGALESQADDRELSVSANLHGGVPESDAKIYQSAPGNSAQRGWKPAASMKPKSLLEIQQEEQQRAQMEALVPAVSPSDAPMSSSTPWAGVPAYTESKLTRDNHPGRSNTDHNMGLTDSSKNKKSELHDLLAAEVLTKSGVRNVEVPDKAFNLPPLPTLSKQLDAADDANFIEAKYTKNGRKKAAKANGAKPTASMTADLTVLSSPVEKAKSSKLVQVEKEVLPAPSSGLSLGDFVTWTEESTSPSAPLAWLSEPPKFPKHTSLRDILREQDKKVTPAHSQTLAAQKPQSTKKSGGSRSVLASSPSKETKPLRNSSESSSQSKFKGDDDFFWGPPEQSKPETKPTDYHQLGNHGGRTARSTPAKGTPETSLSRQKSGGGKASQQYASSATVSAQIPAKGNRAGNSKHSEAMDFRDWCESESVRLTGSKDTSVLEFCLKQTKSEAETLLKENLGSFDPNHEFIEKFLNYMEMLPADVIEIAFQSRNDLRAYNYSAKDVTSDYGSVEVNDRDVKVVADGSVKGSKKKGKKGKKVSSSVLGFNVVSNRIMMGEIQTLED